MPEKDTRFWTLNGVAILLALAVLPLVVNDSVKFVVGLAIIEALFALSWNLLFNYTGIASFGHAAFFAVGAYLVGIGQRYGWPVPFAALLLGSFLAGGAMALFIGGIALRRATGIHFAILTLAVAEVVRMLISYSAYVGRDEGLAGIPRPVIDLGIATLSLRPVNAYYWLILVVCVVLALVLWWFVSSRHGRAARSVAMDPERAAFVGIDVYRTRVLSFAISGGVAGLCGGLSAPWVQIVTPDLSHWLHSAQPMLNTLLGGSAYFWGPAIGAFVYAFINYATRTLAGLSELMIGGILIVIILSAPMGIAGALATLQTRLARKALSGGRPATKPEEGCP